VIETVLGPVESLPPGAVDAHAHIWLDGVEGADPAATFVLSDEAGIAADLHAFRSAGGAAAVDSQPGGAGRNLGALARLAEQSGVAIVASTGFHLRQYHAAGHPLNPWEASPRDARARFERELEDGLAVAGRSRPVRAGIIKTASPGRLDDPAFLPLLRAALAASDATGAFVQVHTERGAGVEELAAIVERSGVPPERVMLCHMDKRPDASLHSMLAERGYLLEYDTFLRPKYDPENGVWPLLEEMLSRGHDRSVACALDLADSTMWAHRGAPLGLAALPTAIAARLRRLGASAETTARLTGGNVAERLDWRAA